MFLSCGDPFDAAKWFPIEGRPRDDKGTTGIWDWGICRCDVCIGLLGRRPRHARAQPGLHSDGTFTPDASALSTDVESPAPRARLDEHATAPAAAPSPAAILYRDSNDYAREIAEKPAFKAFESSANLTPDEQVQVSHILALYSMDDESLRNSTKDADKLSSMRKQLLIHMHVRVRTKIPTKWEAFEQSNLLPSVSDFGNSPT